MKLKRELTLLDVVCISTGAMLSGLFILPGLAYATAGPSILVSYLIAGALAVTGLLSQAELVSAMPKSGGTYFYVTRSMGPAVGTVYGLITWLALSLKSAYELVFMAMTTLLLARIDLGLVPLLAGAFLALFLGANLVGTKEAGRLQVIVVCGLLAALSFYVARGIGNVDVRFFHPFAPAGSGAAVSAAGFLFISFGGLLKVASIAEEVKDPGRTVPVGMILSLFLVGFFYLAVVFVTIGVLGSDLEGAKTPISLGASRFLGPAGRWAFGAVAILAVLSSVNAGIMSASRYPFALARDEMLPAVLGRVGRRYKTPVLSLCLTGGVVLAAMFIKTDLLVDAASSVLILTYLFSCLAVVILRESRLQNYRPRFFSPLYPWVQLLGVVGSCALLLELGRTALLITAGLVGTGLFFYWFFGRIRSTREYALLRLVARITAKELSTHLLETELKEIIRERDDILKDRFDRVIENCPVLDLPEAVMMETFFRSAATVMAPRLEADPDLLVELFLKREEESSTVLTPFLAIPHIIIEGQGKFEILLARCREGIRFSDEAPAVRMVFVLMGSRDERQFHLRALAAIAQVVQDPRFEETWLAAADKEALRDAILLGRRQRLE